MRTHWRPLVALSRRTTFLHLKILYTVDCLEPFCKCSIILAPLVYGKQISLNTISVLWFSKCDPENPTDPQWVSRWCAILKFIYRVGNHSSVHHHIQDVKNWFSSYTSYCKLIHGENNVCLDRMCSFNTNKPNIHFLYYLIDVCDQSVLGGTLQLKESLATKMYAEPYTTACGNCWPPKKVRCLLSSVRPPRGPVQSRGSELNGSYPSESNVLLCEYED